MLGWLLLALVVAALVTYVFASPGDMGGPRTIDWNTIILALVTGMPMTIAAITTLVVTLRAARKGEVTQGLTLGKVEEIHTQTNSMAAEAARQSTLLVKTTEELSLAKGRLIGIADEQARRAVDTASRAAGAVAEAARLAAIPPTPPAPKEGQS